MIGRTDPMVSISKNREGILFNIYVQPRSSNNMIVGLHGDRLKIKVAAPPVDGAANKACLKLLAKSLSLSVSALEIKTGHNSRAKTVLIKSKTAPPTAKEIADLKQRVRGLIK